MDRIPLNNATTGLPGVSGELPAFAKAISSSVTNTITQTLTAKTLKSQKDVFNSKIMKIINNNRKFGTKFSRTNMSSKTDDDGLEEYNRFHARQYDDDFGSSSDSEPDGFADDDSDDDSYFFSTERNESRGEVHRYPPGM